MNGKKKGDHPFFKPFKECDKMMEEKVKNLEKMKEAVSILEGVQEDVVSYGNYGNEVWVNITKAIVNIHNAMDEYVGSSVIGMKAITKETGSTVKIIGEKGSMLEIDAGTHTFFVEKRLLFDYYIVLEGEEA